MMGLKMEKKGTIFLCSISESTVKLIKAQGGERKAFLEAAIEQIPPALDEKKLSEKIASLFKKLGYSGNPIILSLSRNLATCRYLKVPTLDEREIEKIVSLQAPRYLPYPANELITSYQKITADREGFSHVNLIIVHRDVIARYIKLFAELKFAKPDIILNSYGLANFYNYLSAGVSGPTMVIDIDSNNVEVVVTDKRKLFFSRYIKINRMLPAWKELLVAEVNKTIDAYLKETTGEGIQRIAVVGQSPVHQDALEALKNSLSLPGELISFDRKIHISAAALNQIAKVENSFYGLIGLGLAPCDKSLNILPADLKEQGRKQEKYKEQLNLIFIFVGIILIWVVAIAKNLNNKEQYLERIKQEVKKIEAEAKPLEDIEKRFKMIENRRQKGTSILETIRELFKILPSSITLNSLSYEEGQITLRGQTPELNSVFSFVGELEKAGSFRKYNIKVRFATKKKVQAGEIVDFEILCANK